MREAGLEDGLVRLYVDSGEEAVPHVLRLLDGHGLAPSTMNLHRPSLDDVFLKKTGRSLARSRRLSQEHHRCEPSATPGSSSSAR